LKTGDESKLAGAAFAVLYDTFQAESEAKFV
jgi:hypothetical protein